MLDQHLHPSEILSVPLPPVPHVHSKDSLGDRMKGYENVYRSSITSKDPVIIRVDGKAFHTLTATGFEKPYDSILMETMNATAVELCSQVQGTVFAYVQSDEISLLVYPWVNENSQAWFDNQLNKMISVSAGIASSTFTCELYHKLILNYVDAENDLPKPVVFDSRVFTLPHEEVNNYFIWRQKDWMRNSVQMHARSLYSQKQLAGKKIPELLEMIKEKGEDWKTNTADIRLGRGIAKNTYNTFIYGVGDKEQTRWVVVQDLPKFTDDRGYIDRLLNKQLSKIGAVP